MQVNINGKAFSELTNSVGQHSDSLELMDVENDFRNKFYTESVLSANILPERVYDTNVDILGASGVYGFETYLNRRR